MANPRFAWGIDVGNRALKAVKLVRDGGGGMRVDDVDVIEHEHILSDAGDNKESLITAALNTFSAKHPERGGAVSIGVSGQSSFARFIKLPPVEDKKLPEIVRFEAIQQIPFPLDDVEWSYQLFQDEGSPEKEVGIFAMRKELVNQHIAKFTDAGLNVQTVQMNPLAVYNAMYYDQRLKGTTMIVDVGAENTDLIITEGENVWLRSVPVGGNNFTEALVKQFKVKFPKAEDLKRNAATNKYTRQILQAMRPVFDNLVSEIQRSIGFYASVHRDSRIKQVIALGGTFRLPGLMKFLQMQLQLDVQRFDAFAAAPPTDARVATLLNDNVLSLASPYGLALQAMGEGKITSSLLPLAIRRERMWRDKTKWFGAAAALFVLGTGVWVGRYYYDKMQYDSVADARQQIGTQLSLAKDLDTRWKEIEASGEPERKQIASLQSLTKLRELWPQIVKTVDTALPEPDPKMKDKVKRADRPVVLLEDLLPAYYEDLAPAIAKNEQGQFNMTAPEFIVNAAAAGQAAQPTYGAARGAMSRVLSVGGAGGMMMGNPYGPTMGPPPGVPGGGAPVAEGAPAASGKQRGYLLTITVTTPMTKWQNVSEIVREALVAATKPLGTEHQDFRIERVEFVSRIDLKTAPPNVRMRQNPNTGMRRGPAGIPRPGMRGGPPFGGMGGPYGGMMNMEGDAVGNPVSAYRAQAAARAAAAAGRNVPGRPGGPPLPNRAGQPGQQPPAELTPEEQAAQHPMPSVNFDQINGYNQQPFDPNMPQQILDPVTGEDATGDSRLTFLAAVVVEPAPPAPPAPAPGTEGGTPPPAEDGTTPPPKPAAPAPGQESASAH